MKCQTGADGLEGQMDKETIVGMRVGLDMQMATDACIFDSWQHGST